MDKSKDKIGRLILASSSPRRRELLAEAGYDFEVIDPPISEPSAAALPPGILPMDHAEALAYFKARCVWENHSERCVLGADTVVVGAGGGLLGKPCDSEQAAEMLESLSGTRHRVITAVALLGSDGRRIIAADTTFVTMREMSPEEVQQYIDSGEWAGKAGAYAIQETADRFIESIEGSFTNVVGLPMELVARMIQVLGDSSKDEIIV